MHCRQAARNRVATNSRKKSLNSTFCSLLIDIQSSELSLGEMSVLIAVLMEMQVLWDMTPSTVSEKLTSVIYRDSACPLGA
jgi:hypothetical protein